MGPHLLCFLLDLRTIPPPLLLQLKESFLQLANLYAASPRNARGPIGDPIALCYIAGGPDRRSHEFKISYCPRGEFCLRDFHQAVNSLPMECFLTESDDLSEDCNAGVAVLNLLCQDMLYSWTRKDALKKLVFFSSLIKNTEALQKSLVDAKEQYVSVEFMLLSNDQDNDLSGEFHRFMDFFSNLENCSARRYYPESTVLHGLVKNWLQELDSVIEEIFQVVLVFKDDIYDSTSQIYCNLYPSVIQVIDGFTSCQTCRCHGRPVINGVKKLTNYYCQVTENKLEAHDLIENAVKIGNNMILHLPPCNCCPVIRPISRSITMNVIKRIKLASVDEGIIFGMPYVLTPDACNQIGEVPPKCASSKINCQLFKGLCGSLSFLDQGLLCSSTCNTETMNDADIQCFYILQPSYRGTILLRRIAASEEILPLFETTLNQIAVPDKIMNSVQDYISKMPLECYNPLLHERHLHEKINLVVRESLQLGAIPNNHRETIADIGTARQSDLFVRMQLSATQASEAETSKKHKVEGVSSCISEWEKYLVIDDINGDLSKSKLGLPILTSQSKPIDEQTSRILERLEPPKQKLCQASQACAVARGNDNVKRPPVPSSSTMSLSQPLRPTFQRLKRKQT